MSKIDEEYWRLIRERGPYFPMQRCEGLLYEIRRMIAFQIQKETPNLTPRQLDFAVARRLYMSDPGALRLIDKMEARENEQAHPDTAPQ